MRVALCHDLLRLSLCCSDLSSLLSFPIALSSLYLLLFSASPARDLRGSEIAVALGVWWRCLPRPSPSGVPHPGLEGLTFVPDGNEIAQGSDPTPCRAPRARPRTNNFVVHSPHARTTARPGAHPIRPARPSRSARVGRAAAAGPRNQLRFPPLSGGGARAGPGKAAASGARPAFFYLPRRCARPVRVFSRAQELHLGWPPARPAPRRPGRASQLEGLARGGVAPAARAAFLFAPEGRLRGAGTSGGTCAAAARPFGSRGSGRPRRRRRREGPGGPGWPLAARRAAPHPSLEGLTHPPSTKNILRSPPPPPPLFPPRRATPPLPTRPPPHARPALRFLRSSPPRPNHFPHHPAHFPCANAP